jgi:hypothetical protein
MTGNIEAKVCNINYACMSQMSCQKTKLNVDKIQYIVNSILLLISADKNKSFETSVTEPDVSRMIITGRCETDMN